MLFDWPIILDLPHGCLLTMGATKTSFPLIIDGSTVEPTMRSEVSLPPTFSTIGTLRFVKPNIIYSGVIL